MNNIVVRNPNISLPLGSWYTKDEEILFCNKLFVVASILEELKKSRDKVKKLRNYPIHEYTDYLWDVVSVKIIRVGELELLVKNIEELVFDFSRSKNEFVKERSSKALLVMNEIILGNYNIDSSII